MRGTAMKLSALLSVAILLAPGAAIAKQTKPSATGFRAVFPSQVGLFTRHGPVELDHFGDPLADYWAGSLVFANVFYYRTSGHTLEREYSECKDAVKIGSSHARLISDSAFVLSGHRGKRAIFSIEKGALARSEPVKSQLVIFGVGDRFLKFRITYSQAHADRAEQEIDRFLHSYPWPSG
jgi:hypothetical protein